MKAKIKKLVSRDAEIEEKDALVNKLKKDVDEKDGELNAWQDKFEKSQGRLAEKTEQLAEKTEQLETKKGQLSALDRQLVETKIELASMSVACTQTDEEHVNELENARKNADQHKEDASKVESKWS